MPKRKPTDFVQVPVRMQERLRAALEKAAKGRGEKTSLNSEIVYRLEESFRRETAAELMQATTDFANLALEAIKTKKPIPPEAIPEPIKPYLKGKTK
jgi:hypothetical protein